MDDLYAVLGVAPWATAEQVRSAYVTGIRRTHPDVAGGDEDEAKRLTAAYTVLSDSGRRAAYDRRRGRYVPSAPPRSRTAGHGAATGSCPRCGTGGDDGFAIRTGTGQLTVRRAVVFEGQPCGACAKATYRDLESRNLIRGAAGLVGMLDALGYQVVSHTPDD